MKRTGTCPDSTPSKCQRPNESQRSFTKQVRTKLGYSVKASMTNKQRKLETRSSTNRQHNSDLIFSAKAKILFLITPQIFTSHLSNLS